MNCLDVNSMQSEPGEQAEYPNFHGMRTRTVLPQRSKADSALCNGNHSHGSVPTVGIDTYWRGHSFVYPIMRYLCMRLTLNWRV